MLTLLLPASPARNEPLQPDEKALEDTAFSHFLARQESPQFAAVRGLMQQATTLGAFRRLAAACTEGKLQPADVNEALVEQCLVTDGARGNDADDLARNGTFACCGIADLFTDGNRDAGLYQFC